VDVDLDIVKSLGTEVTKPRPNSLVLRSPGKLRTVIPEPLCSKSRAAIVTVGPLLAREGKAVLSAPGGCSIDKRPLDRHLTALETLGASFETDGGLIFVKAGNYSIDATIKLSDNVHLYGEGDATILRKVDNADFNLIENLNHSAGQGNQNIRISSMFLEGGYGRGDTANVIDWYSPNPLDPSMYPILFLDHLRIYKSAKIAIKCREICVSISHISIKTCETGLFMDACFDSEIMDVTISGATIMSLQAQAGGENRFSNMYLGGVGGQGSVTAQFYLLNEHKDSFHGISCDNNYKGALKLEDCTKNTFSDFHITLQYSGSANNTYNAVEVLDSSWNVMVNFFIGKKTTETKVPKYGILEVGTSDFNTYLGIEAKDVGTAGIILVGSDSHCNHSWNMTTWIS